MARKAGRVKTFNPAVLILRNQEYPVEPGILLNLALQQLQLEPERFMAVRGGRLMQPDEELQAGDRVQLVAVIAGG